MLFVFLDEAGYTNDWAKGVDQQPYYALAGVCIPADRLQESYALTRDDVAKNERAYVVYDQNTRLQEGLLSKATAMLSGGATVPVFSWFYRSARHPWMEVDNEALIAARAASFYPMMMKRLEKTRAPGATGGNPSLP